MKVTDLHPQVASHRIHGIHGTCAARRQLASQAPSSSESRATHSDGTAGAKSAAASKHWAM